MANIALISCVSKKANIQTQARAMYTSVFFTKTLKYVESVLKPDKIFILSAKYGLLPLDREIEPYNCTLLKMTARQKQEWADKVYEQLQKECDIDNDMFYILAGKHYYEDLIHRLKKHKIKMEGLTIGRRLQWLGAQLARGCK